MYTIRRKTPCEIKLLRVFISSITRHCFLFSMNCSAKLISKAFFSRLVHSSKRERFSREEDLSQVYGVKKERKPCTSFRRSTLENERNGTGRGQRECSRQKKERMENKEEGRIGPMLYNRSDSLSILIRPTIW